MALMKGVVWLPAMIGRRPHGVMEMNGQHAVVIGDSTVCSQDPAKTPVRGWGQYIGEYLPGQPRVTNLALSGRSSRSFFAEENWQQFLSMQPSADFLFIQFGHNDNLNANKGERETTPAPMPAVLPDGEATGSQPEHYYRHNLTRYMEAARQRGVTPVIVTPMERAFFGDDGKIMRKNEPYALAAKAVGQAMNVLVIDLNTFSREHYESCSEAEGLTLHVHLPTKPGGVDRAHHAEKGARLWAKWIAEQVVKQLPSLKG